MKIGINLSGRNFYNILLHASNWILYSMDTYFGGIYFIYYIHVFVSHLMFCALLYIYGLYNYSKESDNMDELKVK